MVSGKEEVNVLCMNVCLCLFVWRDEGRGIGGHTLTSSVDSFKLDITLWDAHKHALKLT